MLGVWGAALAVIGVVAIETGGAPFRYARHPVGLLAIAGIVGYSIYRGSRKANLDAPAPQPASEGLPTVNRILRIAREHKGRITAAEVLAETALSLEVVRQTLDELTYAGTCQLIVGDRGMQIYYFPEFEDAASKQSDALADASETVSAAKKAEAETTKR